MNQETEQALLEQAITYLGYLLKSDVCEVGWEHFEEDTASGITVYTHDYPKSVFSMMKASLVIDSPLQTTVDFFWNAKEADFKQFNNHISSMIDYEETENSRVREIFQWFPYPIWPRQLNFYMQKCLDGNQNPWILQKSVYSEKYPLKAEHVRSNWTIGAYRFLDVGDNKTEVTRILHFDDGGNIPTMFFLQNSYISIFAEELKKMKAHLMAKEIEQNPSRFDTSPRDNMNISLEKIKKKEPKEKKFQITDDFGEKLTTEVFDEVTLNFSTQDKSINSPRDDSTDSI